MFPPGPERGIQQCGLELSTLVQIVQVGRCRGEGSLDRQDTTMIYLRYVSNNNAIAKMCLREYKNVVVGNAI